MAAAASKSSTSDTPIPTPQNVVFMNCDAGDLSDPIFDIKIRFDGGSRKSNDETFAGIGVVVEWPAELKKSYPRLWGMIDSLLDKTNYKNSSLASVVRLKEQILYDITKPSTKEATYLISSYIGSATNNVAEYMAAYAGLYQVLELLEYSSTDETPEPNFRIWLIGDSQLVINQLKNVYQVKHPEMKKYYDAIMKRANAYDGNLIICAQHVPRELNGEADALATAAINYAIKNLPHFECTLQQSSNKTYPHLDISVIASRGLPGDEMPEDNYDDEVSDDETPKAAAATAVTDTPRVKQMRAVQQEALELFRRKNADYGDAFADYGTVGVIVRIGDKIRRLSSITKTGVSLVNDESLRDTLIDLHNYAAMAVMLMDEKKTD